MKKITDERLILQSLKNVRIVYVIQTFGIMCILGYELFQGGLEAMRNNPLWTLFTIIAVVSAYLQMNVSLDHEKEKDPKRSFRLSVIIIVIIAAILFYATISTPNYNWKNGLLISAVMFICGLIPAVYMYYLRKKRLKDIDEEE